MHGGSASILKHAFLEIIRNAPIVQVLVVNTIPYNQGILSYGRPDRHFALDPGKHKATPTEPTPHCALKGSIEGVGIDQPFTSKTFQIPVWQLLVKRP